MQPSPLSGMKPEYLNSLKAGIKTAVVTFITAMVGVVTSLMSAAQSWANTGNPPDLSILRGTAVAAVLALVIGLGNVVLRFIQAAGVPIAVQVLDKLLGAIPEYTPPPHEGPVDEIGGAVPNPNVPPPDRGQIASNALWTVVAVLAIVALIIWIVKN